MEENDSPLITSATPETLSPVRSVFDEELADEIGRASFPASDPPATWTWDPR